jgi:catechol 2,3-dioxygenase-like lactoylglutathione lyase family enzyme
MPDWQSNTFQSAIRPRRDGDAHAKVVLAELHQKDVGIRCSKPYNVDNEKQARQTRKHGWKMFVDTLMPASSTQQEGCEAGMKLRSLVPVLDVHDVEASIEFYCGALGFTLYDKVEWGGKTEWALLRCDHVQLMLCASHVADSEEAMQNNADGMFFLYHDNLESLQVYLGSRGYTNGAADMPTSQTKRDFYLRDPDGYVLWFSHKPALTKGILEMT